jgi:hypothetical protein
VVTPTGYGPASVYIIASTAGSRVVGGASVAGVSVVDDSVVGASDAVEVESPPPQAEIAIVATRLEITKERRNDMPVSLT